MTNTDPTLERPVIEFAALATAYCKLIEEANSTELLQNLQGYIPMLYLRGNLLKASPPEYPEANERFVTEEEWEAVFLKLRNLFSDKDEFWHIDYVEANHNDPVKQSLSECLTDAYQDLKDFLLLYKQNSLAARQNAVFSCQQLFYRRWGLRLAIVLPYLHGLLDFPVDEAGIAEENAPWLI